MFVNIVTDAKSDEAMHYFDFLLCKIAVCPDALKLSWIYEALGYLHCLRDLDIMTYSWLSEKEKELDREIESFNKRSK